jgi:ketosteroid isomerase-like protein
MIAAETTTDATLALVTRFENGFNSRDLDTLRADMTEDCVFEHVAPPAASAEKLTHVTL